jgi:hypothetical protein
MTNHRHIVLSERQKADFAAMTDEEFKKWFYGNIGFIAQYIEPYSVAVPARIVRVTNAIEGKVITTATRLILARGYYATSAYQRLFVEQEVAA